MNKTSLLKSFRLLKSSFQKAIYDALKFLMVLAFFGALEMIVFVKHWLMLLQRCFEGSKLLVHSICHFKCSKNAKTRKNLETSYIALWKRDSNKQKDFERKVLLRNGVT